MDTLSVHHAVIGQSRLVGQWEVSTLLDRVRDLGICLVRYLSRNQHELKQTFDMTYSIGCIQCVSITKRKFRVVLLGFVTR